MKTSRVLSVCIAIALTAALSMDAGGWGRKKTDKTRDRGKGKGKEVTSPVVKFLKDNGIDLDKKVVALRVTGEHAVGHVPRAVMKVIAIHDSLPDKLNALSAIQIKNIVGFIVAGKVVEKGDTVKVATVEVYLDDGSSFNVTVGQDFSQIVFEKIISKPENPFSKEPVEKEVKLLSFVSPGMVAYIRDQILAPKTQD
jgi:hypothetical protein